MEPLYGDRYLPRKFKVGLTVPGDNSVDIYTNDIGLVVMCDKAGNLEGAWVWLFSLRLSGVVVVC